MPLNPAIRLRSLIGAGLYSREQAFELFQTAGIQRGDDVVIRHDNTKIVLQNTVLDEFTAAHFIEARADYLLARGCIRANLLAP